MKKSIVNSKTTRFLIGSFIGLIIVSIIVFLMLGFYMNRIGGKTINVVGELYMTGISDQIAARFQTLIDAKFEQAEAAVEVVSPDNDDMDALYSELTYRVQVRDFEYLALCSQEGELQEIYGNQILLTDPEPFFDSLKRNERKVAVGVDDTGRNIVLFGVEAGYPMLNGEKCMAMIVALPVEYISDILEMEREDALVHTHIIRKDGSFVIHDPGINSPDYFSNLYVKYTDGKTEEIRRYIEELSVAMEAGEDYSTILRQGGSRQQIYSTSLAHSEWYLVTILPYGILNETVNGLSRQRTMATVAAFLVICA